MGESSVGWDWLASCGWVLETMVELVGLFGNVGQFGVCLQTDM